MSGKKNKIHPELKSHIQKIRVSKSGMTAWYKFSPEAWGILKDENVMSGPHHINLKFDEKSQFGSCDGIFDLRTIKKQTRQLQISLNKAAGLNYLQNVLSPLINNNLNTY